MCDIVGSILVSPVSATCGIIFLRQYLLCIRSLCIGCHSEVLPLVAGQMVGGPYPVTNYLRCNIAVNSQFHQNRYSPFSNFNYSIIYPILMHGFLRDHKTRKRTQARQEDQCRKP